MATVRITRATVAGTTPAAVRVAAVSLAGAPYVAAPASPQVRVARAGLSGSPVALIPSVRIARAAVFGSRTTAAAYPAARVFIDSDGTGSERYSIHQKVAGVWVPPLPDRLTAPVPLLTPLLGYVRTGGDRAGLPRTIIGTTMQRDTWAGMAAGDFMYPGGGASDDYPTWVTANLQAAADVAAPLVPHNITPGEGTASGRKARWDALLDEAIAGTRDTTYTAMGGKLAQHGPVDVRIRLWSDYNELAADVETGRFKAAWRRAVPLIRQGFAAAARPGQTLQVAFSYSASSPSLIDTYWPGSDVVDIIAASVYAGLSQTTNPTGAQVRTSVSAALAQLAASGETYGKPVALGEYGLSPLGPVDGSLRVRGSGDDPVTAQVFADWINAQRPTHAVYVDITDGPAGSLDLFPTARDTVVEPLYISVTGIDPPPENPDTPLKTLVLTPDPPTLLPAELNRQQATFQTPPNVEVFRTTQVRRRVATGQTPPPYLPDVPAPVTRIGTHTATFGGPRDGGDLEPGQPYRGRMVLDAVGYQRVERFIDFTTATTVGPQPLGNRLRWGLPEGWDPTVIPATTNMRIDTAGDYEIDFPATTLNGFQLYVSPSVVGDVRVAIIGGHVKTTAVSEAPVFFNCQGIKFLHVEGLRLSGPGASFNQLNMEGIRGDFRRFGSVVQIQNILIDQIVGTQAGAHSDLVQIWAGPAELRIDRLQGKSNYQGFIIHPRQFGPWGANPTQLGDYHISNVWVDSDYDLGTPFYSWHDLATKRPFINTENLFVTAGVVGGVQQTPAQSIASTGEGNPRISPSPWVYTVGTRPPGDTVLTGTPGIGYVSPGYLGGSAPPTLSVVEL